MEYESIYVIGYKLIISFVIVKHDLSKAFNCVWLDDIGLLDLFAARSPEIYRWLNDF